jgi:uncharacterized membrane protein YhaH (DUF805 family)
MMNFLFSPNGRINRYQYWLHFMLPYIGISIVAAIADVMVFGPPEPGATGAQALGVFGLIVGLFFFWPSIAVTVKRLHDRGISGWWVIWPFVPLVVAGTLFLTSGYTAETARTMPPGHAYPLLFLAGLFLLSTIIVTIQTWFLPSQQGENDYGEEPAKR